MRTPYHTQCNTVDSAIRHDLGGSRDVQHRAECPSYVTVNLRLAICRPDAHRSRPFASLSNGQQALATLALSFALQAAFPSPFYFFDEIDSALDTRNASRVADYIASQTGAQYLVVSHKPQVQSCYSVK